MKKILITIVATVLVCACIVGGTFAWLMDKTDAVKNTFTVGKIDISLSENTGTNYKIVPGVNIDKDPAVKFEADSEACWLFVKIDEADWSDKLTYTLDNSVVTWTELTTDSGIWYVKLTEAQAKAGTVYNILANKQIEVDDEIVNGEIKGQPTLTFTAYAIQSEGFADAATAWAEITKP